MSKPKVLISPYRLLNSTHPELTRLREAELELVFNSNGRNFTPEELAKALDGCIGTMAGAEKYIEPVFEAAKDLKVIARLGVGWDAVDVDAATRHGVILAMAFGSNHESVADLAFSLMGALATRLFTYHPQIASGGWQAQTHDSLWKSTIGIIGLGRIGKAVVRRAKAFEMRILVDDIKPDHAFIKANGLELVDKDAIFRESDIVTLHCSANAETADLINARSLGLMKPTAFLINAARGSMVDEEALTQALESGRIAGAGLDVFKREPPIGSPLLKARNAIFTPHAAGGNKRAFDAAMTLAVDNILAVHRGGRPREDLVVNPEVWQRPRRI
ncbi:MAG: hydroxyacid dehydrogenase [Alphaproteobacteria bacterium]|nr:hydroxyacid dehydrogenase [Alphaproteobacteria bacterium]